MICTSTSEEKAAEIGEIPASNCVKKARVVLLTIGFVLLLHSGTASGQKVEGPEHVELQLIGGQVEKFDFE